MVFPFILPGQLQPLRKRFFYWRVVNYYKIAHALDLWNRKPLHKFGRFFLAVMAVKALEKGARARTEEHLSDYNARKANLAAAEAGMWDEELHLHTPDLAVAEASVHRQRMLEWTLREKPDQFALAMMAMRFPFRMGA